MTKQRQLFAFGFGLAFVEEAQAGLDPCCIIPATPHCNAGIGSWEDGMCIYYLVPGNDKYCQTQVPPQYN